MSTKIGNITRIIACMVFKPALEHYRLKKRYPDLRITYLPSHLHLKPQKLKTRLLKEITSAQKRNERVICLYGECFPDIGDFCKQQGVTKVPGAYCHEMLLGTERFRQLIDETTGTYFAEKDLIQNFEEYCLLPLELNDDEMRKFCFEHYQRLLYVRQPSDPDLMTQASELAEFLDLSLDVSDAEYSHLEEAITGLLQ